MNNVKFKGLNESTPLRFEQAILLCSVYLYNKGQKQPLDATWNKPAFCHLFAFVQQKLAFLPKSINVDVPFGQLPSWTNVKGDKTRTGFKQNIISAWNSVIDKKIEELLVYGWGSNDYLGDPKLSEDGVDIVELLLGCKADKIAHIEQNGIEAFTDKKFINYFKSIFKDDINVLPVPAEFPRFLWLHEFSPRNFSDYRCKS